MNSQTPLVSALRAAPPRLLLAALIVVAMFALPTFAHAADPSPIDWTIDQSKLIVRDAQEESWLSDGDEPYIGVIAFRSRFGQVGSTSARFLGGLKELHSGADDGDSMTIPDSMGRSSFLDVVRLGGMDMAAGAYPIVGSIFGITPPAGGNPEILGTVTVAMESDSTPFSIMSTGFKEAAKVARKEIAAIVETTTIAEIIADPATFEKKVNDMATRLRKRAELSVLEKIGQFIVSVGDPDDRIGAKVALFVGGIDPLFTPSELSLIRLVRPAEAEMIEDFDETLAASVPPGQGVAGLLKPRNFTLDFAGDGATYRVSYSVAPF